MRVLISNDDGIESPGLAFLADIAGRLFDDVWVVAPDRKHTAASHRITIGSPLRIANAGERRFVCSGTPADCVVACMTALLPPEARPDLVLSGINDDRNVAEDLIYSGTLAIAREATFWGVPAIAVSQVRGGRQDRIARDWLASLLAALWRQRTEWAVEGHWLSLNLPTRLPAPLSQAVIGRDKIASAADVLSSDANGITLQVRRGRERATAPGDENNLIEAGYAVLTRLNWFGATPLAPEFVSDLAGRAAV
jgi:5'-nucleotidase